MKTTKLIIASVVFLFISCSSKRELSMYSFFQSKKYTYKLTVPFKFTLFEKKYRNAEDNPVLKEARMSDGSVIYITNDTKNGGDIEDYRSESYGDHYSLNYFVLSDTASLSGNHNGKYWKEIKRYSLFVGYYGVPEVNKRQYDEIINTIIPQVNKTRGLVSSVSK